MAAKKPMPPMKPAKGGKGGKSMAKCPDCGKPKALCKC